MNTTRFTLTSLIALTGCTRHYMVVGESDTSKPIAVSIMKSYGDGQPVRLFYTELTGNDTEFVWDQTVATWIGCHRRAFEWFGAVPERLIFFGLTFSGNL